MQTSSTIKNRSQEEIAAMNAYFEKMSASCGNIQYSYIDKTQTDAGHSFTATVEGQQIAEVGTFNTERELVEAAEDYMDVVEEDRNDGDKKTIFIF